MNKSILIKLGMFVLGGAVGFLVGKKFYRDKFAAIADEEIESVKEAYDRMRQQSESDDTELSTPTASDILKKAINPVTRSSLDENPYEQAKRNYNLTGKRATEQPVDPDGENEEEDEEPITDDAGKTEEEMDLSKVDRTQPYVIDSHEFTDEFDHHDKLSLYYYRVDDVLCDEDESVIEEIEETVGYDAISVLDKQTTVWVRNEPLCTDYEIVALNESYSKGEKDESGKNLTPREVYQRKNKRRPKDED